MTHEELIGELYAATGAHPEKEVSVEDVLIILRVLTDLAAALPRSRAAVPSRLTVHLPVAPLGFFLRLATEEGLFGGLKRSEIVRFHAWHFCSPHTLGGMSEKSLKNAADLPSPYAVDHVGKLLRKLIQRANAWPI